MIEFYPEIRSVHIAAVFASGALFLVRGLAQFGGARWGQAASLRYLSWTVDTILLTAALMLMTVLRQYPFVQHWLTAKVLLLVVYITLGFMALHGSQPKPRRLGLWLAALGVYLFIISIARARSPLGIFA